MSKKTFREESPTYQIGSTGQLSKKKFQQLLKRGNVNLSPEQVGLLNSLIEKDGQSMQELSTLSNRDNSATTRIIDNLVKKSFVQRRSLDSDRRIWLIFITPKGENEVIRANLIGRHYVSQVLNGVDKDDLKVFMKVIKNIHKNISKM